MGILVLTIFCLQSIKQQVDTDEMQLGFMSGCGAKNASFILRQL